MSQILLTQTVKMIKTNCKKHQSCRKCSFKVILFDLIAFDFSRNQVISDAAVAENRH